MYIEGINPTRVLTAADLPPAVNAPQPLPDAGGESLALGTMGRDQLSNEYILLQSAAAIAAAGFMGFWDENFIFTLISNGNDVGGVPLAANRGLPTAAGQRFWAQTYGMGTVQAAAAAAADVLLFTSATPGAVDDVSATFFPIEGLAFMVAATGAGAFNARLANPRTAYLVGA